MIEIIKIFFRWMFIRIFGLRDINKLIDFLKKKYILKKLKEHFGTIIVSKDYQIDSWVEPMDAGTKSCPYWYSTRLFMGIETSPGIGKDIEYWVGIRVTFLAPIIPIPICSNEIVFKIGNSDKIFYDCYNNHGKYHSLIDYKEEYTHCIINNANVRFINSDIDYNNDEIWSSYD